MNDVSMPGTDMPGGGMPSPDMSGGGMPGGGMPSTDMPGGGMPSGGMPGGGMPGGMSEFEPTSLRDLAKKWRRFSDDFDGHKTDVMGFAVGESDFPFASARLASSYQALSGRLETYFGDGGGEFTTIADKLDEAATRYGETEDENTQLAADAAATGSETGSGGAGSGPSTPGGGPRPMMA